MLKSLAVGLFSDAEIAANAVEIAVEPLLKGDVQNKLTLLTALDGVGDPAVPEHLALCGRHGDEFAADSGAELCDGQAGLLGLEPFHGKLCCRRNRIAEQHMHEIVDLAQTKQDIGRFLAGRIAHLDT